MDFEQLNGAQRKILRQTILAAFTGAPAIDMFLNDELSKPPLANFAGGANLEAMVFNMIADAQSVGWTGDLIGALQASRPRNPLVRTGGCLAAGGHRSPAAAGGAGNDAGKDRQRRWFRRSAGLGREDEHDRTGDLPRRIPDAARGTGYGTGILVSGDCVLTMYDVVENHISKQLDPASIICRFDYARDTKGLEEGRSVSLAAGPSWIVASSPYDNADCPAGVGKCQGRLPRLRIAAAEREGGRARHRRRGAPWTSSRAPPAADPAGQVAGFHRAASERQSHGAVDRHHAEERKRGTVSLRRRHLGRVIRVRGVR